MAAHDHDPRLIADLMFASVEDVGYLEPSDDGYAIRFEHRGRVLSSPVLDERLGRAVIARLAMVAELDLTSARTASAVVQVQRGKLERDIVVTVRHGDALRCELSVLPERRDSGGPFRAIDLEPGDRVGHYEILGLLGEGGMGSVFRVRHTALERIYALKILRENIVGRDIDAARRFLSEARSAARIRHPNIVDVFDYGALSDGRPYLVMELVQGHSLARLVDRGPVPVAAAIDIGRQLASALAAAHGRGVVHADVTPSNVLVTSEEPLAVKLVDFGLSLVTGELPATPTSEYVLGTVHYISPEQLRGHPATEQSDQYSLGVVLFELLSGAPPYDHGSAREIGFMHLHAPVPRIESPLEPLPPSLAKIVTKCMQKAPEMRFSDMRAVLGALQQVERVARRRDWTRWLER